MTAEEIDYVAMTIEQLYEAHSKMCAIAHRGGVALPEHLTAEFADQESGARICVELRSFLDGAGVADVPEQEHSAPVPKQKKKRAVREPANEVSTGVSPMTATKTKTKTKTEAKKAAKKPAKKVTQKKTAAAKSGAAKKTRTPRGVDTLVSKVVTLMKRAKGVTREEVLKLTGWKAVSMQQIADGQGVKLKIDKESRPFHYMVG